MIEYSENEDSVSLADDYYQPGGLEVNDPGIEMLAPGVIPKQRQYQSRLPHEFWSYTDDWTPKFEGIQPFLLQGLVEKDLERSTLTTLHRLMGVEIDAVVDPTQMRPLMSILGVLPWIYRTVTENRHSVDAAQVVPNLFTSLSELTRGYTNLQKLFERYSSQVQPYFLYFCFFFCFLCFFVCFFLVLKRERERESVCVCVCDAWKDTT